MASNHHKVAGILLTAAKRVLDSSSLELLYLLTVVAVGQDSSSRNVIAFNLLLAMIQVLYRYDLSLSRRWESRALPSN